MCLQATGEVGDISGRRQLVIYSASHLIVDFACFYMLMGAFSRGVSDAVWISTGFLTYNFIAFALQVPLGYFADKAKIQPAYFAVSGCLLVALGSVPALHSWGKLGLCAFGNAMFHIGGGIDSLVNAKGKFARSGIFISFGAIGVSVGTLAGKFNWLPAWAVLILPLACAVLQFLFCRRGGLSDMAAFAFKPSIIKRAAPVIYLSSLGIVIRAVVGAYTAVPWKSTVFLMILPAICVFAGKLLGGFLADRFGAKPVALASLLVSAPLLSFFSSDIVLCCAGLLLFNVTTAVTLCVIVSKLPDNPGLAFGITTLALFLGSAFSFFVVIPSEIRTYLLLAFILAAAICILLTTANKLKEEL